MLISLPFVTFYLVRQILEARLTASLGALATLIGIGLHQEIAYGAPLLAMWLQDLGDGRFGAWMISVAPRARVSLHRLSEFLIGSWIITLAFVRLGRLGGHWMIGPPTAGSALLFGAIFALILWRLTRDADKRPALASRILSEGALRYSSFASYLPAAVLVVVAAAQAWQFANQCAANVAQGTMFYDLRDAELWARNNTDPRASFIVCDHPWRTVSQRQAVYPMMSPMFVYSNSLAILKHNQRLLAYHGMTAPKTEPMDWIRSWSRQREVYLGYDENEIAAFASEFNGDYVVRKLTERKLNLPEAYRNSSFVIYEIPDRLASAAAANAVR